MFYILSGWTCVLHLQVPFLKEVYPAKTNSKIIECMVQNPQDRFHKLNHSVHLCTSALPPNAIWKTNQGVKISGTEYCSSPELAYLQICSDRSLHILDAIRIACCFCGTKDGSQALTTVRKLKRFVLNAKGHAGRALAKKALKYALDKLHSVMEIQIYMILHLPHALGGFALPMPESNSLFMLSQNQKRGLAKNYLVADFVYEKFKFIIEFNSYAYHNNALSQAVDPARANALENMGYTVKPVSTYQIYNLELFFELIKNLLMRFGKRLRIRSNSFKENFSKLREMLPRNPSEYDFSAKNEKEKEDFFVKIKV